MVALNPIPDMNMRQIVMNKEEGWEYNNNTRRKITIQFIPIGLLCKISLCYPNKPTRSGPLPHDVSDAQI
eukprot:scaffold16855_cov99-Skeletonema_dohrnii-CCMP3373.AAC.2